MADNQQAQTQQSQNIAEEWKRLSKSFFDAVEPSLHTWDLDPGATWFRDFTAMLYGRYIIMHQCLKTFEEKNWENGWGMDAAAYHLGEAFAAMIFEIVETAKRADMKLPDNFVPEAQRLFEDCIIRGFRDRMKQADVKEQAMEAAKNTISSVMNEMNKENK